MQKKYPGHLIMIDGLNGVGKDEQATRLCVRAQKAGLKLKQVYVLKANQAIAKRWKGVESGKYPLGSAPAQALEFFSFHQECIEMVVKPLLASGENILMNRGPQTTLVYNVLSRKIDRTHPELVSLSKSMLEQLNPDLGLILDLDPQIALNRIMGQAKSDQFQDEVEAYDLRRRYFLEIAKSLSWKVIDASGSIEEINELIWQQIEPIISKI